jgi:AraC-like DNA-binding protein
MTDLHFHMLVDTPLASLSMVRCRECRGRGLEEQQEGRHTIVLPVEGLFVKEVEGRKVVGSPAQVLFFPSGEIYRVSHPADGGDACLTLGFETESLLDGWSAVDPGVRDHPDQPFGQADLAADPHEVLEAQRLRHGLERSEVTVLEAEERILGLLASLARRSRGRCQKDPDSRARRMRRERSEILRYLLARDLSANPSLASLARVVGCSAFHLARGFKAETGQPIHRHLMRLRLLSSLERLPEWKRSLGALAQDLGFASHAHFTAAFHAAFGLSPAAFRDSVAKSKSRDFSKNLKAARF